MTAEHFWDAIRFRLRPGYLFARAVRPLLRYGQRDRLARLVRARIPARPIRGASRWPSLDEESLSAALERDGYCMLGRLLDDDDIARLHEFARETPCFDQWAPHVPPFRVEEAPPETHVAEYSRSDLYRCDLVLQIANDPGILRLVQRFLGATPTLSNVTMWWSLAGRETPQQAQLFHRDYDDLRFCKLFVYLTDVDAAAGPHVYVRGSARREDLFVSTSARAVRFSDEEVRAAFGEERIVQFCAPKGSAFLVDTWGVHKGLNPVATNRLLLQCQYSLLPIAHERYYQDRRLPGTELRRRGFDPYINRLVFQR